MARYCTAWTSTVRGLHLGTVMVTRAVALLLSLLVLATPLILHAQTSPPASDQRGTTGGPGDPPPAGGDAAAQWTIFGSPHRLTVVIGAVLVVLALGLFVAGLRRGPRAAGRARRRREEAAPRERDDRVA
jgi:hypothetical protein